MPLALIDALVIIKMCAAKVNTHLGAIDKHIANAIITVCEDILKGKYYDQFPLSI
jgi:fumarate hydratase class II